jgi:hypothetical protein
VHKGRAVCRAVGGIIFSRAAAVAESNDLLRPARTFPTVSGLRDRAASEIDKAAHPEIQKLRVHKAWRFTRLGCHATRATPTVPR